MFRSNLRAIQLLAIAKTSDIRSYGCVKLLHEFIDHVNLLSSVGFLHMYMYAHMRTYM